MLRCPKLRFALLQNNGASSILNKQHYFCLPRRRPGPAIFFLNWLRAPKLAGKGSCCPTCRRDAHHSRVPAAAGPNKVMSRRTSNWRVVIHTNYHSVYDIPNITRGKVSICDQSKLLLFQTWRSHSNKLSNSSTRAHTLKALSGAGVVSKDVFGMFISKSFGLLPVKQISNLVKLPAFGMFPTPACWTSHNRTWGTLLSWRVHLVEVNAYVSQASRNSRARPSLA